MPFLNLFRIPTTFTRENLEERLKEFGTLDYISLKSDNQNNNVNFASINFEKLCNKEGLLSYLKTEGLHHSRIKASNEEKNNNQHQNKADSYSSPKHRDITGDTIKNPSFHYYKSKKYGKEIEKFQFSDHYKTLFTIESVTEDEKFELTTIYPGLLVGSGYNHPKLKENKDDFQLGFFFDHTTGLPMIPGSSIKGVIRALFSEEKFGYIQDVYAITEDKSTLEQRLFIDGSTIFYDAYIVSTSTSNNGKIFGSDYITSHYSDESLGQFKEPNPIKFLKVLPDVTFAFQFKGRQEDVSLIKSIILDFGLGAKTNVGYGQFKAALTNDEISLLQKAEEQKGLEMLQNSLNHR